MIISNLLFSSDTNICTEWTKSTDLPNKAHNCDFLIIVLHNKANYPYGSLELLQSEFLKGFCFLLDGRGLLPHFWWIATLEHAKLHSFTQHN
jgi:hypothetical protein